MKTRLGVFLSLICCVIILSGCKSNQLVPEVNEEGARVRYCTDQLCMMIEFHDDGLMHVEYAAEGAQHDLNEPIWTSPLVQTSDYTGPQKFSIAGDGTLVTDSLEVTVDNALCITASDTGRKPAWEFTQICPKDMEGYRKQCADKGLPTDDETVVLFAMFPQQVEELHKENAAAAQPQPAPAPAATPAAPAPAAADPFGAAAPAVPAAPAAPPVDAGQTRASTRNGPRRTSTTG